MRERVFTDSRDSRTRGVYLGAGKNGAPNRHVRIREVTCTDHHRQGISVITAENLLIENTILKNTAGTPPAIRSRTAGTSSTLR